ncbi:MAG TPA: erythromycin esterase family protein [Chitinophagaceae bacterium]|jgi:erythromycin esterase-like protein|nr:erythromycin esterase family protein [Chitinophagaceae bacterium]
MDPYSDTYSWLMMEDLDQENNGPLNNPRDLDPLMERIGDAHYVLLGEASHGTHEYYTWRTAISKRLIEEKDFNFIAVEGDWPDCYKVNRFVKGYMDANSGAHDLLDSFDRWPTWMWANWEIMALIEWLRKRNDALVRPKKAGFYGLDVYSLWESMRTLIDYLQKTDPTAADIAKKAINCFEPYGEDWQQYVSSLHDVMASCKDEVVTLLSEITRRSAYYDMDPEASLNTRQNAYIAVNAEQYYSSMLSFDDHSWNIRDIHMVNTLDRIMDFHGPEAKAILWAHNTHIGDARFTDMKKAAMVNVGQLVREQHAEKDVVLAGFGSYQGTVIAGETWGAPMKEMEVPAARKGSVEDLLHQEYPGNRLLILDKFNKKERLKKTLPHRAIGVVYDPGHEQYGNYVPTELNPRYDAFLYIDQTQALHPLHIEPKSGEIPESYPFGF